MDFKFGFGGKKEQPVVPQNEIGKNEEVEGLQEKLKHLAYVEAHKETGTPLDDEQADVFKLRESDVGFIEKAKAIIDAKLSNPEWVKSATEQIKNSERISDFKPEDPGYPVGSDVLKKYNKENYGNQEGGPENKA